jgi:16S rRNA (guanine(966)-N(2))-methyltransferase RsmD
MSLKIASGLFKGRVLKTPDSTTTRPTTGMLRQAVFNICQDWVFDARFLDLFAGSGAMGFEALSRGASFSTFIEWDKLASQCIRENGQLLSVEQKIEILSFEAKQSLLTLTAPYDLIYIDPPYDKDVPNLFGLIIERQLLAPGGLIFLEERFNSKKGFEFSELELISSRRYGGSHLHQFRHSQKK